MSLKTERTPLMVPNRALSAPPVASRYAIDSYPYPVYLLLGAIGVGDDPPQRGLGMSYEVWQ